MPRIKIDSALHIPQAVEDYAAIENEQPIFTCLSGAHMYGFNSKDSDFDIRGTYSVNLLAVLNAELVPRNEIREESLIHEGYEIDVVKQELRNYCSLLMKGDTNAMEQLYSPCLFYTSDNHWTLKHLAKGYVTKSIHRKYLGFAQSQWKTYQQTKQVKKLLYTFRTLLTGIHLMREGRLLMHLPTLNQLSIDEGFIDELIEYKKNGSEKCCVRNDVPYYESLYNSLSEALKAAAEHSQLPDQPIHQEALPGWLVTYRLRSISWNPQVA
jgi:uncharacterized protein